MLRNIPSAALKELVKLSERKEALMSRIQQIDRQMVRVQDRFGIPTQDPAQGAAVTVSRSASKQGKKRPKRSTKTSSAAL